MDLPFSAAHFGSPDFTLAQVLRKKELRFSGGFLALGFLALFGVVGAHQTTG